MQEKVKIIDEITKRHPSIGVEKGWSTYVGGMADTGHWYFRKMLDVPTKELQAFLDSIIAEENKPAPVYTEEEQADMKVFVKIEGGGVMSLYNYKQWEKFAKEQERKIWFGE